MPDVTRRRTDETVQVSLWTFERRPPVRDRYEASARFREPLHPVVERRELHPTAELS
jgi:hypothetical protein